MTVFCISSRKIGAGEREGANSAPLSLFAAVAVDGAGGGGRSG